MTSIIPNSFLLIEVFLKTKNFFEKNLELLFSFQKQKNEKFFNFPTSKLFRQRNTALFVFFEILFFFLPSFQNRLGFPQNLYVDFLKSFSKNWMSHFSTDPVQKFETYRSENKAPYLYEKSFFSFFQKEINFSFFLMLKKNKGFLCSFSSILFFFLFLFFKNKKFSKISHNFFQTSLFCANLQYLQKGSFFLKNFFEDFEAFFSFFEFSSKISQSQFALSLNSFLKETQGNLLRSEPIARQERRIKGTPFLRVLFKNQRKFQSASLENLQTCFKSQNMNSFMFKKTLQKNFFSENFNAIFFDSFKIFPVVGFEKKFDFCAPLFSSVPYPFFFKKGLQNFLTQQFFRESKRTFQKSLFHFQKSWKKKLFRKTQNAFLWLLSKKGAFRGSDPWLQKTSKAFRNIDSSKAPSSSIASESLERGTSPSLVSLRTEQNLHFAPNLAFVAGPKQEKISPKKKSFFFFVQNSFFVSKRKPEKSKSFFSFFKNFFVFANEKTHLSCFFRSFHKNFLFSNFSFFCFSEFQNFFMFFENFFQTFTRIHQFFEKEFLVNLFKKDKIQKVFLSFLFQKTFFFFENMCFQKKTFFQTFREGNCFFPKKSLFHNLQIKKALFSKTRFFFSFFLFFPSFLHSFNVKKKIEQKFQKFCKKIFFEKFKKSVFRVSCKKSFFFLFFHLQKSFHTLFSNAKMPNRSMLRKYLNEWKDFLQRSRGKTQLFVMKKLQQKICRLWACFSPAQGSQKDTKFFSKQIFLSCDSFLFQFLWSWARKRHPNKSKSWIQKKYFHLISEKKWVFGKKSRNAFIYLTLPSDFEMKQNSSNALF
jgi:hypothetical protein